VDDVAFSRSGPYGVWHWQHLRERRAEASSHKFPTYSPGGGTLFVFVVVYNGSKSSSVGVRDDDMRGAAAALVVAFIKLYYYKSRGRSLMSTAALFNSSFRTECDYSEAV